ncbi:MAG: type II toxin-antitoxin system YafQ family toxin [Muribaculaceae bacterium]|nr:type II toxin-antitoxin system YafQ family toxin [Muribaculaceae bacterium]
MAVYHVSLTGQFKKDLKQAKKRGLDLQDLFAVIELLANDLPLPEKNRDHQLHGDYIGYRECHISPDWLLIYQKDTDIRIITLYRTGTHSDLFNKKRR